MSHNKYIGRGTKYVWMEMKDKRNRGVIVGNYYRPSGSDKRRLRRFVRMKTSKGWDSHSCCYVRAQWCSVTFLHSRCHPSPVWGITSGARSPEKSWDGTWKMLGGLWPDLPSRCSVSVFRVVVLPSAHPTTQVTCPNLTLQKQNQIHFLCNLFVYGVLPALGLVSTSPVCFGSRSWVPSKKQNWLRPVASGFVRQLRP